jgi:hypothetical protein
MNPVILDKLYIPEQQVKLDDIRRNYEYQYYNESFCSRCPNLPNRPNLVCQPCPHNLGLLKLWNTVERPDGRWYGLPTGNIERVCRLLHIDITTIRDNRPIIKAKYPLKFIGKLWDGSPIEGTPRINQIEIVRRWLQYKNGIVRAPPRSGKSAIICWLSSYSGLRTVILVNQDEQATQYYKTFCGDESENITGFTNALELEQQLGFPVVKIINRMQDFNDNISVAIVNYQKMMYDLNRIAQYINGKFSFVAINECHRASAQAYSAVVGKLNCKWRMGVSATTRRKDYRHLVARDLIGPVTAESITVSLLPQIYVHYIEDKLCPYKTFARYIKWLGERETRDIKIMQQVFVDLKAGHRVIIIPLDGLAHQQRLVDLINAQGYGADLAVAFNGRSDRKGILKRIDSGKHTIVVAIRKMIKEDINMLWPSMLYSVEPASAAKDSDIGAPMFQQLSFRVATPFIGKLPPVVRVIVDPGISHACFKSLFRYEIKPNLKPHKDKEGIARPALYKMDAATLVIANELLEKSVEGMDQSKRRFNNARPSYSYGS